MASITVNPDNDGFINCGNATYSNVTSGLGSTLAVEAFTAPALGQVLLEGIYSNYIHYFKFDTSSIPAGSTVTSATLSLYIFADSSDEDFNAKVYQHSWTAPLTIAEYIAADDFSSMTSLATLASSTATTSAYNSFTGDLSSIININGDTDILVVSDEYISKSAPTGNEYLNPIHLPNPVNLPKLDITYYTPNMIGFNF